MRRAALCALLFACHLNYTGGARAVQPNEIDASWLRAAPTPVVRQAKLTDCGLAALAMVAGAWGQSWSVTELAVAMPPGDKGVRLGTLRDYARDHGLEAYAIKATTADLSRELQAHRPVLVGLLLPYDYKHAASHYEVVVAINPHTGAIVTIDPQSGGEVERSAKVLDAEWKAAGYPAIVIVGPRAKTKVASRLQTHPATT
jgi:ABC-type bacteriocin/lantibiotic exporter with double-glycine peptidase domain